MASTLWIITSALLFAVLHSITATPYAKKWCYQKGIVEPYYRLLYVVCSIASTVLWFMFIATLPDQPLYQVGGGWSWLLMGLQFIGLLVVLAALLPIDGLAFLGLRRFNNDVEPLLIQGIYRYLRHPMYSGFMLMMLARPEQSLNGLTFTLAICLYFIVGSRLEESRMLVTHPKYADYQHSVPAFIPLLTTVLIASNKP